MPFALRLTLVSFAASGAALNGTVPPAPGSSFVHCVACQRLSLSAHLNVHLGSAVRHYIAALMPVQLVIS